MAKEQKNIAAKVEKAITEPLAAAGFDVWDVEYVKEGSEWYLRVTVDRTQGVDMDACEQAFRIVDPIVNDLDPVETAYHLEVSSPGLERALRTDRHFEKVCGQPVCLKLFTAIGGKREIVGVLKEVQEKSLALSCGEELITVEKKNISKANVWFDFDALDLTDEEKGEE